MIAYFDSNVWIAFLRGEATGDDVKALIAEINAQRGKIITSVITLTEISVRAYTVSPVKARSYYEELDNLCQIINISPEIADLTAKIEAQIFPGQVTKPCPHCGKEVPTRNKRWDAFHLATAAVHKADTFYTFDKELLAKDFSSMPLIPAIIQPKPAQRTIPGIS